MWNKVLNRLPDNYKGLGQDNIKKLHQVIYSELEEAKRTLELVRLSHDLDKATGKSLDYIGANVMQSRRPNEDDDTYRLMIKVKAISNLSKGDINTINQVAKALFGDKFVNVKETWGLPEYKNEPAALVLNIIPGPADLPSDIIRRTVAGGIDVILMLTLKQEQSEIPMGAVTIGGEVVQVSPQINTEQIVIGRNKLGVGMYGADETVVYPK